MSMGGIEDRLPKGWSVGELGEYCEMYQPQTISKKEMISGGEYPVFGANGQIGWYSDFNHEDSEVTISCRGNCGSVNVIPPKSWITGNAMVVRPKSTQLTKSYLGYLLRSVDFRQVITGTAQQQITRASLTRVSIVVPPLPEQDRIVEILEEQLSRLDATVKSVQTIREKATQFRRSLLHAAFTGALTRPDFGSPSDAADLGVLPENWRWCRLSDFVKHKSGDSKIIKGKQSSIPDEGLYQGFSASGPDVWVGVAQYSGPGVVVSAVGARCGKTFIADGEWTAIANTHVLRPSNEVDNKFLWYLTNREEWWQKSGTAQPFVKVKDSLERPFALPPRDEQVRIVQILEEQLSRLDATLVVADEVERKTNALRRSLLHAAFTGELTRSWREANV